MKRHGNPRRCGLPNPDHRHYTTTTVGDRRVESQPERTSAQWRGWEPRDEPPHRWVDTPTTMNTRPPQGGDATTTNTSPMERLATSRRGQPPHHGVCTLRRRTPAQRKGWQARDEENHPAVGWTHQRGRTPAQRRWLATPQRGEPPHRGVGAQRRRRGHERQGARRCEGARTTRGGHDNTRGHE